MSDDGQFVADVEPPRKRPRLDVEPPPPGPKPQAAPPAAHVRPQPAVIIYAARDRDFSGCTTACISTAIKRQCVQASQASVKAESPVATPPSTSQRRKVVRTPQREAQELPAQSAASATGALRPATLG